MAFKHFSKLSSRNQSSVVSQIHKMITYFSSTFSIRERVYLKKLSQADGNIYWLEDGLNNVSAAAIIDPNYNFEIAGIPILSLSHTISKRPGQMERILQHIFSDHSDKGLFLICRDFVAESMQIFDYGLVKITPVDLINYFSEIAETKTDFFNVKKESFAEGLSRKNHNIYLFLPKDYHEKVESNLPTVWNSFLKDKFKENAKLN